MKKDFCYIGFILDRSGSMDSYGVETVVASFNKFVKEQKETPGTAHLYFMQFDTQGCDVVYDGDIQKKTDMYAGDYSPRAGTPLRDAMGKTIDALGKRFEAMREDERPDKVVIVTLTDGLENASTDYTAAKLAEMIRTQETQYNWQFVFLGANQDAILTGERLGIQNLNKVATFGRSRGAMVNTVAFASSNLRNYRISGQSASLNYTVEQRKQMEDDPNAPVATSTTTTTPYSRK